MTETTFEEWYNENLSEYTEDIVNHGCGGGFSGITYYSDTVVLFEDHKQEIFDKLVGSMENCGYSNIYELLGSFNKDFMPQSYEQFANQLVWFMVEETARAKYFRAEGLK